MSGDENRDRFARWGGHWPGMGAEMSTNTGTGTAAGPQYLHPPMPASASSRSVPSATSADTRSFAASTASNRPIKREDDDQSPDPSRRNCDICLGFAGRQCPLSDCRCPRCVRGEPEKCIEAVVTTHRGKVHAALQSEHAYIRQSLQRIERLVTEDHHFLQHHERHLWKLERDAKDYELANLRRLVDELEEENHQLNTRMGSLQRQHSQPRSGVHHTGLPANEPPPIVHHASLTDNLHLLNSGIPRSLSDQPAGGSSSEAGIYDLPPSLFGEYTPMSPEIGHFDVFASQEWSYNTAGAASPEYSPPSPSLMMNSYFSNSSKSPKRPASAIDGSEANMGIEGIAPRTSAAQGSISAPAPQQEAWSPPIKRQRSMSQEYYVITSVKSEPEADKEELRRLTMYAGHTPNHSTSTLFATAAAATATATAGPSRGGTTPTASSSLVDGNTSASASANANELVKTELEPEVKADVEVEVNTEETNPFHESLMRHSPPLPERSRHTTIPENTEGPRSQIDEAFRRQSRLNGENCTPPTNPGSSALASPASQRGLLEATEDQPLTGPLMIRNIPEQDVLFLEVLNEKLGPISQGQDSLPKVVQDLKKSPVHDDTERLETQSDSGEEADGVLIRREPESLPRLSGTGHGGDDEDALVEIERPIRREDSDSDSDSGPEITLKLRHTSNFGAPFGRM
ncbi:hypothetical protein GGI43DRAFT_185633 [Trichoderma evansii]